MKTKMIEATGAVVGGAPFNWGKFLVGEFTDEEWAQRSAIDPKASLLAGRGLPREVRLVVDLETGEGGLFLVRKGGHAQNDLNKRKIWVCVLFEAFLCWLYQQDLSDLDKLPAQVALPHVAPQDRGYRRPGPDITEPRMCSFACNCACHRRQK